MVTPSQFALSSKRWRAGLGGMLLMVAVSTPWLGIAPVVAEQLREFFAAIVLTFIAGQTVTDVATKGRTSGSFNAGAALSAPPANAGRAALPALLLAAGLGLAALTSCSEIPFFGNVAAAEERAAAAELELAEAQAAAAAVRAELALAGDRAAELEALAVQLANAEAAAAAAAERATTSAEAADSLAASLAAADAARSELARLLASAPSSAELEALRARLEATEAVGASAAAAAAVARDEAAAARQAVAEGTGAAAGLAGPGLGQVLSLVGLLGAAGAAEWGRTRALKRAAETAARA